LICAGLNCAPISFGKRIRSSARLDEASLDDLELNGPIRAAPADARTCVSRPLYNRKVMSVDVRYLLISYHKLHKSMISLTVARLGRNWLLKYSGTYFRNLRNCATYVNSAVTTTEPGRGDKGGREGLLLCPRLCIFCGPCI
jgi:hypothetical protein